MPSDQSVSLLFVAHGPPVSLVIAVSVALPIFSSTPRSPPCSLHKGGAPEKPASALC